MHKQYQFRFAREEFSKSRDAPKHLASPKSNSSTMVIELLDTQESEIESVRAWARKHRNADIFGGALVERIFSAQEVKDAESFYLSYIDTAPHELDGESFGTEYEFIGKCGQFDIRKQVSPLRISTKYLSKTKDIQRLLTGEVVVSLNLKQIIESVPGRSGALFSPIWDPVHVRHDGDLMEVEGDAYRLSEDWFQLQVAESNVSPSQLAVFGPSLLPTFDEEESIACPDLGLIEGPRYDVPFRLKRETWKNLGFQTISDMKVGAYPEQFIFIDKNIHDALKGNGIKGYISEPVKLLPE